MRQDLLTDGKFDEKKFFTSDAITLLAMITYVEMRLPESITLDNGDSVPVTPSIATGAVGKAFDLKIKRELPVKMLSDAHERTEDVLEFNRDVLIIVARQFEMCPRLVFVGDPHIPEIWRSARAETIASNHYEKHGYSAIEYLCEIIRLDLDDISLLVSGST